jgi:hypothetical protein
MQGAWRGLAAAAVLAWVSPHASAQADDPAVLRLAALVTQALPVDKGLQRSLERDPRWPLMDRADKVQPADLQCIRARLAPDVYRSNRLEQARRFAAGKPEQLTDALRVLEQGAAEVLAVSIASNAQPGAEPARRFSPAQATAFGEFMNSEAHRDLRDLMGVPEKAARERPSATQRPVMQAIAYSMLVAATTHCKVPLTAIQ